MRRLSVAVAIGVAAMSWLSTIRAQEARTAGAWAPSIEPLADPAGANSVEPQLTREGSRILLSWLELQGTRTTLRFAERTANGWSETRTVASGDDFMVNSADAPSVRLLADGQLVAHWLQQDGPDPESYKLRLAWSKDEGRTWSASVNPHHDTVQTQHGFASLFQAPGAGLVSCGSTAVRFRPTRQRASATWPCARPSSDRTASSAASAS